jgi:plastocyanin
MIRSTRILVNGVVAIGLALTFGACGSDSNPAGPNTGDSGTVVLTITIEAAGVSPKEVTIAPGQRVRFVNNDSVSHTMFSDPHPAHTDCPGLNAIDLLNPGQSKTSNNMDNVRVCTYHDEQRDTDARYRGTIRVQ